MMTKSVMADQSGDERIRGLIREHALSAAEGPFKAEIAALYEMFDRHNRAFFGGELKPVTITVSPPQSAKAVADARENSGWGGYQEMRIRPSVVVAEHPTGAYAANPKRGWRMRPGKRGTEDHHRWLSDLVLHEINALGRVVQAFVLEPKGPSGPIRKSFAPEATPAYGEYLIGVRAQS